jgi:hypothetical protein
MGVRTYRMTIASTWYDKKAGGAKEYELHFKIARRGDIRRVRRNLARRSVPYFQQFVYRRLKRWVPKAKIKVRFEREEPATRSENTIRIEGRSMLFKGKRWSAYRLGPRMLNYAKKKRKRKAA